MKNASPLHRLSLLRTAIGLCLSTLVGPALGASVLTDWATPAEASDYTRTPRLAETMAYFERLDAASEQVALVDFGTSPQGRTMTAVIVSSDGIDTPAEAEATGKPIVFIQAAIHPGENEGKDVLMALVRDLTVSDKHADLLDAAVLVLVPVFNIDGHERFSPYNRINQNGPEAMGWRGTAQNLNLNRDYTKLDAPEMRAWMRLWNAWSPDLLIDLHNTNGADYQYAMTWAFETAPNIETPLAAWQSQFFDEQVKPKLEEDGWPLTNYFTLADPTNLSAGLQEGASDPRFSAGYAAAVNRAGLLVETHMLKDFRTRVAVNEALLVEILRRLKTEGASLRTAVAQAQAKRFAEGESIPLAFGLTDDAEPQEFLGVADSRTPSTVSGTDWVQYDPTSPIRLSVPVQKNVAVLAEAAAPAAYLIPLQWQDVIDRLEAHGIAMHRVERNTTVTADRYRFEGATWAPRPFEGRHGLSAVSQTLERSAQDVLAGSMLIPMDQEKARLIALLLEPASPDSFLRWGFFNAIFEEKEYAEPRVLEVMAREMMAKDPALKAEFEARVAADAAFAADPRQRLRFFYMRSPYFDTEVNRYPVLRLDAAAAKALRSSGK